MKHIVIENGAVVGVLTGPTSAPGAVEVSDDDPRIAAFAAIVPVHSVRKLTIIERLNAAGKLAAADAALQANLLLRMKWEAAPELIPHNHADVVAFMQAIGADPAVILATEAAP